MVSLVFTGKAINDPTIRPASNGNTVALFAVEIKQQPHLPPTTVLVVAIGKLALYAQQAIRKDSMVVVDGWFYIEHNKRGDQFVEVKAKHLSSLVSRFCEDSQTATH